MTICQHLPFLLDIPYLYGDDMRIKSTKEPRRKRSRKKEGVLTMEKVETRLLQISRFPLDLDDELKIMAIRRRVRPTEYIVEILRDHVEQERKVRRGRERRDG